MYDEPNQYSIKRALAKQTSEYSKLLAKKDEQIANLTDKMKQLSQVDKLFWQKQTTNYLFVEVESVGIGLTSSKYWKTTPWKASSIIDVIVEFDYNNKCRRKLNKSNGNCLSTIKTSLFLIRVFLSIPVRKNEKKKKTTQLRIDNIPYSLSLSLSRFFFSTSIYI